MESTIGRYRLLKRLATGGMGEVYLAAQTGAQGFQKFVALKRVAASAAEDPELISLFLDEARLVATLAHRSIVQVSDLGQDEHGFFVAMEFVQGPSVRALLDRLASQEQRLSPALALDIAAQVGDALACAYYSRAPDGTPLRIIHRDVSPRNILTSVSGDVKLIDFGIAQSMRQVGTSPSLTGKLAYMSPEQLRGEPLNARSDLFSLGIVLCEMLGGENPFARAEPKEIVVAIQREEPRLPSARDPALSPCDGALKRLLAKLPSDRFADGIELAEALAELRTHFPKPPKRLGAVVADLFGLEIAELLREASVSASKLEAAQPAPRPPQSALNPPPREPIKDAGLGSDAVGAAHPQTPSVYHRVTQPYLSLPKEAEVTQPDLAVPKILRSEAHPAAPVKVEEPAKTAQTATLPEADSGDVEEVQKEVRAQIELPKLPLAIDLPELKELAEQKAAAAAAAAGAQSPVELPGAEPLASGGGAVPGPGEPGFDESKWFKNSIPPGRAPGWMAQPPLDPITPPVATAPVLPALEPAKPVEPVPPPSEPAPALDIPDTSGETTLPVVLPRRSSGVGLPIIAVVAVLIGVAIGLYLVREPAPPPARPKPVSASPLPAPAPAPTPAPAPAAPEAPAVAAKAEPPAPEPARFDPPKVEPLVTLAPLAPFQPASPAVIRSAVEEKPEPKHVVEKVERRPEKERPVVAVAEPRREPEAAYRLVAEGAISANKPMPGASGFIHVGDTSGMSINLGYEVSADGVKAKLDCAPWAIAAVNGLSVGRTPIALELKEQPVKVELRRPGAPAVNLQVAAHRGR